MVFRAQPARRRQALRFTDILKDLNRQNMRRLWKKAAVRSRLAKLARPGDRRRLYGEKTRLIATVALGDPSLLSVTDTSDLDRGIIGLRYGDGPRLHQPLDELPIEARRVVLAILN